MLQPLDGPSVQDTLAVTTEVEAKVGASAFEERKVITLQPDDKLLVTFESGQPGFTLAKNGIYTFEASNTQPVYITAVSGTVNVIVAERA
jgi:hypothetical protein